VYYMFLSHEPIVNLCISYCSLHVNNTVSIIEVTFQEHRAFQQTVRHLRLVRSDN